MNETVQGVGAIKGKSPELLSPEVMAAYVIKWLNISWLLEGVAMRTILMSLGLASYLLLAAGIVAGELEALEGRCVHCRMKSAGVTTSVASKATRKLMRYHGVSVLKTVGDESYMLYKGHWARVTPRRPT